MSTRWLLALLLVPAVAGADTVTFKNGSRLQGATAMRGETLEIRVPEGSLFFARSLVAKIDVDVTPLQEYEARLKALGPKDARATVELAEYCDAHAMKAQAEALWKKALALQPAHEGARQRLGYRKVGERWVTASELMSELGLVQYKGEWMSPRAARDMQDLEERTRSMETRLATLERDSGELKRDLDEERRAHDRAERYTDGRIKDLEAKNKELKEQPPVYYYGGWGYLTNRRGTTGRRGTVEEREQPSATAFGIPPVNKTIVIP